ncbi:hypothetical protein Fmac_013437 [Flemingia macrophylla]|uniref:Bet v I/Major latex protein domain-containing protein n=1 Tax=Flemingia macrophylla TaxID=520843 RepID=A0ABD1MT53_9FABA
MGVFTSEVEYVTSISAANFFKAAVLNDSIVMPKALPKFVKSIEIISGDGGPGTIRKHNVADGYSITEIVAIDKEKYEYKYIAREGRRIGENLEKVYIEYKMIPREDGGCIIKKATKHYTKNNHTLDENYLKADDNLTISCMKLVDDFLLAHPEYYH